MILSNGLAVLLVLILVLLGFSMQLLLIFASVAAGLPSPLMPLQILFINLATGALCWSSSFRWLRLFHS